jgi:arylsulfatase A-like enzyme
MPRRPPVTRCSTTTSWLEVDLHDGWKAELAYPSSFITGNAQSKQVFDENAWELYNLNEDYTERIDLAKKYPEKLAELKAEFEEQAKAHHLYPYITWDDVLNAPRIHRTKDTKSPFLRGCERCIP